MKKDAAGSAVLTAPDGATFVIPSQALSKLQDPAAIFSDWRRSLQALAVLNVENAKLLKRECPTDAEYRELRSKLRML
jgi:hypothetical protein